jgi:hypothetical protein
MKKVTILDLKPHLQTVFIKMYDMVGAPHSLDISVNNLGWMQQYTWTKDQENEFLDWLTDYLNNSQSARREIMIRPQKRNVKKTVSWFNLMYCWKTID